MHELWQELRTYCGESGADFHPEWQAGSDHALVLERDSFKSQARFLKESGMLPHYMTAVALSGWLEPAWQCIRETVAPCSVLDYRAGIGATGLHLAGRGYDVSFYDEDACAEYLQWRCDRRGLKAHKRVPSGKYDLVTLIGSTGFMDSGELIAEVDKASGLGAIVAFDVNACTPSTPPWSRIDVGELLEKIATKYVLLRHAVYDEIHHVLILVPGSTEVEAEETVQGNENALADAETAEVEPETGDDGADASEPETDYGEGEEASGEEDAAAELPDENPGTIEDQEDSDG